MRPTKALLDAMWQTMSRAGGSTLQHCLAWQLEGPGRVFVNQLTARPGINGDFHTTYGGFAVLPCEMWI